jgi:hypothetical protein
MRQKSDIIIDLEENEILPRLKTIEVLQSEVDALQQTVSSLRMLEGEIISKPQKLAIEPTLQNYPGYPMQGTLIEKYSYLEDKELKVWSKDDLDNLIEKIEGPEQGAITLRDGRKKIYYYIRIGKLIRVTFADKRKYTFFTTRMEWFERQNRNGEMKFYLLPEHQPKTSQLAGLTEEQLKSQQVSLNEIN